MFPCKLPCTVFIDWRIARLTSFLTIYSIIFYGKELTCSEATDPLISFNRHTSSVSLKQHWNFLDHVIFLYIENWLAMMSKMAARVLKYELGSPSYGDLKLEN